MDVSWGLPKDYKTASGCFNEVPSFNNYRAVFIDPGKIAQLWTNFLRPRSDGSYVTDTEIDEGLGRGLLKLMEVRRRETTSLLKDREGVLFCKFRKPDRPIQIIQGETVTTLHNYSWLPDFAGITVPEDLELVRTEGTCAQVIADSHPASSWFRKESNSVSYEVALEDRGELPVEDSDLKPIASDPSGKLISFELRKGGGKIIMLPPRMGKMKEPYSLLLEILRPRNNVEGGPPNWASNYFLGAEREITEEIADLQKKIGQLKKRSQNLEEKRRGLENKKALLYASRSESFVTAATKTFTEIGLKCESTDTPADFLVRDAGRKNLVCAAVESEQPIGTEPYHRLLQAVDEASICTSEFDSLGGTLLYNGFARLDPSERPKQYKEEVEQGCLLHGFNLLSSVELFQELQKKYRSEDTDSLEEFRTRVLSPVKWKKNIS